MGRGADIFDEGARGMKPRTYRITHKKYIGAGWIN